MMSTNFTPTQVDVFYTHFDVALPNAMWQTQLQTLPIDLQQRICRYRRWQDQHAALFAKLLLKKALQHYGYDDTILTRLRYTSHHRPYIDTQTDFNLSHSQNYVICAIAHQCRLGIDVEYIRDINLSDFAHFFPSAVWTQFNTPSQSLTRFFQYWTQFESVIKAEGCGLSCPEKPVIQNNIAQMQGKNWFLHEILLDSNYAIHLATQTNHISLHYHPLQFI